MNLLLIDWAIRSTVLLGLGLGGAALLRRRPAWRHTVLAAALVAAAGLPLVQPMAPRWRLPFFVGGPRAATSVGSWAGGFELGKGPRYARETPAPRLSAPSLSRPSNGWSATPPGSTFWGTPLPGSSTPGYAPRLLPGSGSVEAGRERAFADETSVPHSAAPRSLPVLPVLAVAVPALILLRRGLSLMWIAAKARSGRRSARLEAAVEAGSARLALTRRTEARFMDAAACPTAMTWGHRRPMVAMPAPAEEWPGGRVAGVVLHELAHVKRGDWLVQQTAGIAASLLWFNPLAWLAYRRLRSAAECAADDLVLEAGLDPADYARHLLDSVRARSCRKSRFALVGVDTMSDSHFETRIKSIVSYRDRRGGVARPSALVLMGASLTAALALVSVAGARPAAAKALPSRPSPEIAVTVGATQLQARQAENQRAAEQRLEAERKHLVAVLKGHHTLTAHQRKALIQLIEAQKAEPAQLTAERAKLQAERRYRSLNFANAAAAQKQAGGQALRAARAVQSGEVAAAMARAQAAIAQARSQLKESGQSGEVSQAVAEAMKALQNVDMGDIQKAVQEAMQQAGAAQSLQSGKLSESQQKELRDAMQQVKTQMSGLQSKELAEAMEQLQSQKGEIRKQIEEAMSQLKQAKGEHGEQSRAMSEAIRKLMLQKDLQKEIMQAVKEAMKAAFEAEKEALGKATKP